MVPRFPLGAYSILRDVDMCIDICSTSSIELDRRETCDRILPSGSLSVPMTPYPALARLEKSLSIPLRTFNPDIRYAQSVKVLVRCFVIVNTILHL